MSTVQIIGAPPQEAAAGTSHGLAAKRAAKRNLTEVEASEEYGPSVHWFRRARWEGNGPRFIKLTGKILYPRVELESFFAARLRRSTSDRG